MLHCRISVQQPTVVVDGQHHVVDLFDDGLEPACVVRKRYVRRRVVPLVARRVVRQNGEWYRVGDLDCGSEVEPGDGRLPRSWETGGRIAAKRNGGGGTASTTWVAVSPVRPASTTTTRRGAPGSGRSVIWVTVATLVASLLHAATVAPIVTVATPPGTPAARSQWIRRAPWRRSRSAMRAPGNLEEELGRIVGAMRLQ